MLIIMLSGCTKSRFMDLSGFVYNYKEEAGCEISITDFIFREQTPTEYKLIKENILISLKEAPDGKICECRVMLLKRGEDGEVSRSLLSDSEKFIGEVINIFQAYCAYDRHSAKALAGEFSLVKGADLMREGELTKQQDKFYFVYYSTVLVSQVTVYDTYLTEIETTKKPKTTLQGQEKSHPSETDGNEN